MKNLLIVFGGKSSEYKVSLMSVCSVLQNIDTAKYSITKLGITKDGRWFITDAAPQEIKEDKWLTESCKKAVLSPDAGDKCLIIFEGDKITRKKIDVIFPVMHGNFCEDGCIQGLFELSGIPYVGSAVLSSSMCMDKSITKLVLSSEGIPQADWVLAAAGKEEAAVTEAEAKFKYPVFVKPCNAGSSFGTAKAANREKLCEALKLAGEFDSKILIEEYINGREIECAVLGNDDPKASVLGEISPSNEFYDYDAKYVNNASVLTIPADLPKDTEDKIREYAVRAFKAAGCKGMARVDFFVCRDSGKIYLNEINTLPGFTNISMYPKLWEKSGLTYSSLIDNLIEIASTKHE